MYKLMINNYIKRLTKSDIIKLASANNIYLNNEEIDILYYHIKNNNQVLLYGDYKLIFNDLKTTLSHDNYHKILNLYTHYKELYKHYL